MFDLIIPNLLLFRYIILKISGKIFKTIRIFFPSYINELGFKKILNRLITTFSAKNLNLDSDEKTSAIEKEPKSYINR